MAVSDKLTYLNTTKGLIKDNINLTGANITSNDTFRSYATKLKNGLVDIINNGIDTLYDNFPKVTAEGTEIVLNDTYEAPLKVNAIKGDTQQDTYSGKNLNKYPYNGSGNSNGITFTPNSDGTIVINGQNNGNGNSSYQFHNSSANPLILEAGTYYIIPPDNSRVAFAMYDGINYYDFTSGNNYRITFNQQVRIRLFYIQILRGTTVTFTDEKVYPMLSTLPNQTKDDYEPYVGSTSSNITPSPNPDYPQEVKVVTGLQNVSISDGTNTTNYEVNLGNIELCKINTYEDSIQESTGKNLFDINETPTWTGGGTSRTVSDNILTVSGNWYIGIPINVKANTQYYISANRKIVTDGGYNNIGTISIYNKAWGNEIAFIPTNGSFNTGNNTSLVVLFRVGGGSETAGTVEFSNIQVEEGPSSTDYEPFGKVWYKKANIGKLDMSTITGWAGNGNGKFYVLNFPNNYGISRDKLFSNIFNYDITAWAGAGKFGITTSNNLWIDTGDTTLILADDVPNWLLNKNAIMYGILVTPTYEIITDTNLINQLESIKSKEGTTNITISGNLPMIINASALEKE